MEPNSHTCLKTQEFFDLRENIVALRLIQAQHADLLKTLAEERIKNAEFKARIGGVVIATSIGVSAVWAAVLAALQFWRP